MFPLRYDKKKRSRTKLPGALRFGATCLSAGLLCIGGSMTLERYTLSCCLFQVGSDTAVVRTQLTDTCGHDSNPGKCEARGALCVNSHCACVDERHPLKLPSVHTVCWPEVRLGARCYFKVSLVLTVAKDAAAVSVLEFVEIRGCCPRPGIAGRRKCLLCRCSSEQWSSTFSVVELPMQRK